MLCSSIAITVIIFNHYVLNKNCVCLKEQHKPRLHFSKAKNEASSHLNDTPLAWLTWCPTKLHLSDNFVQEKTESAGSETPDEADEKVEPMIPTSPGCSLWPHGKGGDFATKFHHIYQLINSAGEWRPCWDGEMTLSHRLLEVTSNYTE